MSTSRYAVGVDVGGTFTDLVALAETGGPWVHKVPSDPSAPAEALLGGLDGLAASVGLSLDAFLPRVDVLVHGSTVALNTLIQGRGARTGLLATEGHQDSLEIRLGHKEDGHRWDFSYPAVDPLVPADRRLPVPERVLADGSVLRALDEAAVRTQVDRLAEMDVEAVAISCMWSTVNSAHEERIAALVAERLPDVFVSVGHRVLARPGEYARTSTTCVNAYVGPAVRRYMRAIEDALTERGLRGALYFMQSNGGVATREALHERPVATLGGGPAAGPTAALRFSRPLGYGNVILMEMGGTSLDVCTVRDGLPDIADEADVARHRLGLPMVNVSSIGAGGGSIAHRDARGVLAVGPQSAEAQPGPACYGRGGTRPTVTDALCVLGYLDDGAQLAGQVTVDAGAARRAVATEVAEPLAMGVEEAAQGIVELTINNIVDGVRRATVERGYDPRDFVLVAGGGAGALFAGCVANELGISTVVVPRHAGALCAFGQAAADLRHDVVRTFRRRLRDIDRDAFAAVLAEMESEARDAMRDQLRRGTASRVQRVAEMKYVDQVHECEVTLGDDPADLAVLAQRFHERHEELFSYREPDNEPEVTSIRLSLAVQPTGVFAPPGLAAADRSEAVPTGSRDALLPGTSEAQPVPVYDGRLLEVGATIPGPAIVDERTTTIVVLAGSELSLVSGESFAMRVGVVTGDKADRVLTPSARAAARP